jgi:fimbrial chaperone protein
MKFFLVILANLICISLTHSGVSMLGTRVILSEGASEKTLVFKNSKGNPSIVQVWVDDGDDQSTINSKNTSFIINPQIFKIQEDMVQSVRLIFLDKYKVPLDKESLYFLNFMEIPMVKENTLNQNKLSFLFKNRIKIFYRPKGIVGNPNETIEKIIFKLEDGNSHYLVVTNPTNFYINFNEIKVGSDHQYFPLDSGNDMVPPQSSVRWKVASGIDSSKITEVKYSIVNDYGVVIHKKKYLNK